MDIVERLREYETWSEDWPIIKEAADEIERLRKQERKMTNHALERMEEIERLREEHHDIRILNEQYFNENDILIDEIERLREALKLIAAEPIHQCVSRLTNPPICDRAWIARSALQQKESESP